MARGDQGREEVRFNPRVPSLTPTVRPQGTFTPVASISLSRDTEELLRSVRALKGEADTTFAPMLRESREEQFKAGTAAMQANQVKFADAVSKGFIPETANPWFIKGYRQQEGRVDAIKYDMEKGVEYARSGVRSDDSAEGFIKWQGQFRQQYAKNNQTASDADYITGFNAGADVSDAQLANQHIRFRQEEISNRVRENTGTEISAILSRNAGNPEAAAKEIGVLGEKMKADGLSPTDFRRIVAEQVISTAKLTANQGPLGVLDRVKLENGQPLSTDAKVKAARAEVETYLLNKSRSNQEWAWRLDDRKYTLEQRERARELHRREDERYARDKDRWDRDDFVRNTSSTAISAILASPEDARNVSEPYLKELAKRDPDAARTVAGFAESVYTSRRTVDDREENARLRWEIVNSAGDPARQRELLLEATRLAAQGKINPNTLGSIIEDANRWRDSTADRVLAHPSVRLVFDTVRKVAQADPQGLFGQAAANALMGERLLRNDALDFLTTNPNATPDQLATHLEKRLSTIKPLISPTTRDTRNPVDDIQSQARTAQSGIAPPTLAQDAERLTKEQPAAVQLLIDAVAKAPSGDDAARVIQEFDAKLRRPGLAQEIITREAVKRRSQEKGSGKK